jgi:hypothetical protein
VSVTCTSRMNRHSLTIGPLPPSLMEWKTYLETTSRATLSNLLWDILMFTVTMYMLSGDTVRVVIVKKEHDWMVEGFSIFALGMCVVDMMLRTIADFGTYFNSFLFWMDLFSIYSICWDISVLAASQTVW